MDGLSPVLFVVLSLSAFAASFIQRVSGFGFGIFIMTILPYVMPSYGESTSLSGLLALTQSFFVVLQMRKYLDWRKVLPILSAFLVTSYFCIGYVAKFDTVFFMHFLGVVLILLSLYFLFFSDRIHIRQGIPMQLAMGSVSGVMGGFFGMQGPPAVLYFVQSEPDKNHYVAQTQFYFVTGNIFMTLIRFQNGFVTEAVGQAYFVAIGAVALGSYVGTKVFNRISSKRLRKVIYGYMAISGVVAILK